MTYTIDSNGVTCQNFQLAGNKKRKWASEHEYRLIKELWAFAGNHIAVRFSYEWYNDAGEWFRSYGNENWEFNEYGLM